MFLDRYITLNTVYSKNGNKSFTDTFTITQSPWVINWKETETSNIGHEFYFDIWHNNQPYNSYSPYMPSSGFGVMDTDRHSTLYGVQNLTYFDTGVFTIKLFASGCKWWFKIGAEPRITSTDLSQQIIGKWQYECPANITMPTCRQQDHQLEFSSDWEVTFLKAGFLSPNSLNDGIYVPHYNSKYSLINNKLEIYWIDNYESYTVNISDDKLTLSNQQETKTYHRIK